MPELAKNPDLIGVNLSEPVSDTVKKTFLQHALGPRGGLFLLGVFTGLFIMHVYMTKYVYEDQITDLKMRIEKLEAENQRLNKALQDIAFEKIE